MPIGKSTVSCKFWYFVSLMPAASLLWLTTAVILGGLFTPGYSHLSQFMSELGATDAPAAALVNGFGFLPAQILMVGFLLLSRAHFTPTLRLRAAYPLLLLYALGLAMGALFPCDAGCRPQEPSLSQQIHNSVGLVAYLAGIVAIFLLSGDQEGKSGGASLLRWIMFVTAVGAFILMLSGIAYLGLAQRILECMIYLRIIQFAFNMRLGNTKAPKENA